MRAHTHTQHTLSNVWGRYDLFFSCAHQVCIYLKSVAAGAKNNWGAQTN